MAEHTATKRSHKTDKVEAQTSKDQQAHRPSRYLSEAVQCRFSSMTSPAEQSHTTSLPAQRREAAANSNSNPPRTASPPNRTGLPDRLKTGIENLSGYAMDDVQVQYNSSKPAQLNALAYAQGNEIHLGSGQEKHLPHEAWHVVQQMQGKVKPTLQMKGVGVNDDVELEKEADLMGRRALQSQVVVGETWVKETDNLVKTNSANNADTFQRLPSNNNDPTTQADGTYFDRDIDSTTRVESVKEHVTAIMKNPDNGGVPSVSPPGWTWLRNKIGKLKGDWVRFHIINEHLGGLGNNTSNLVPTSVAVNNQFSRDIEQDAKTNAITNNQWTYVDVSLTYDATWPAPIPKSINAEWGKWDGASSQWVKKNDTPLNNPDITQLGTGYSYMTGVNINQLEARARGVPANQVRDFTNWLKTYTQNSDSDNIFQVNALSEFGIDAIDWIGDIWMDESDANAGEYVPVMKAKNKKRKRKRGDNSGLKTKKTKLNP